MVFRRARSPADTVAPSASADEQNYVAAFWRSTVDHIARSRRHNRADFHTLCDIAFVVDFGNLPCCQTYLVAVAAVAVRRARYDFALRKLSVQRFFERRTRVARARYAHRLIDIAPARERVADCTAETRCRAAERFDFRRMVVRFVFEHHKPRLLFAVDINIHYDACRVDFFALFEIGKLARLAQSAHTDKRNVHQTDVLSALGKLQLFALVEIFLPSGFGGRVEFAVVDFYVFEMGKERGVAAVVAPIGVEHSDFGHRRVALFGLCEIVAAESQVLNRHRKRHLFVESGDFAVRHRYEARNAGNRRGNFCRLQKRLGLVERRLAAVDCVYQIFFDARKTVGGKPRAENVHPCAGDGRSGLCDNLHALFRRIGALVELAGEVLDGENRIAVVCRESLLVNVFNGRFAKNQIFHSRELRIVNTLDIVALENAHRRNFRIQVAPQILEKRG